MEQYGHDQLVKDITELKTKQIQHRKDIDQLMSDNRIMLAMNQNVEQLTKTIEKLAEQMGSAIERIESLENRPAQAMYTKVQEIRDKVVIGVCTSGIIAAIVAIIELVK